MSEDKRWQLLLGEKTFQFSPAEWISVHRRLFEGVFDHAGQIRTYNITKKEWVLKGDTVTYASWNSIKETLDYVEESQSANREVLKCNNCTLECSLEELAILKVISDNPQITQKELAEKIGRSQRTISTRLKEMQEKNYIQRVNGKRYGVWEVLADINIS